MSDRAGQALQNVADVLRAAGGRGDNIVRMTWYVTDKREYLPARPRGGTGLPRDHWPFRHRMTAVEVKALIGDRAKVEIEVTAMLPS